MTELFTVPNLIALISLAGLEIVLGIDNIVFIAIVTGKLPRESQARMRRLGLILAMVQRILLLMAISWVVRLTEPLFTVFDRGISGRDLILVGGGLFLIAKATFEVYGTIEGEEASEEKAKAGSGSFNPALVLAQITLLDIIFSLDSVITAVGMVNEIPIMVAAVVLSVIIMMTFATPVSDFIVRHPSIKMLALAFLLMIGCVLVMDGTGVHVPKGYVYFAMGFAIIVETLNFRMRGKHKG